MDELKRFKKKHKLTKKEKERVEMWVESGHSAYDTRWWDELEQEEECSNRREIIRFSETKNI